MFTTKLAVLTPHANELIYGKWMEWTRDGVVWPEKTIFLSTYYLPVEKARNQLVYKAFQMDCTHYLFLDDDILIPSNAPSDLIDATNAPSLDINIVGAPCPMRTRPGEWNVFPGEVVKWQGIMECAEMGTGCLLVKREVFTRIANITPVTDTVFFKWAGIETNPCSEDIVFCRLAGHYGFKIYVDTALKCKHISPGMYTSDGFKPLEV